MDEGKKVTVITTQDLQKALGMKGALGRWVAGRVLKLLELDKINAIQEKYPEQSGAGFSESILKEIGVSYEIPDGQLDRIPAEGGFITVSNHHFGSIDGLILNAAVGSRRPDFRILTTFLLTMIPGLRDSFIPVDNFATGGARSISGIRTALGHIAEGKPLGFFPAGEVATWQKGRNKTAVSGKKVVEDIPWADNISKLIRKSGLPVVPIYFEGENSRWFHRWGRIHPRLRTVRLVHEMFNKPGSVIQVRIGQPIPASALEGMDVPTLGRYLRSRCYSLQAQCLSKPVPAEEPHLAPIAEPVPAEEVRSEIARLEDKKLFETGDYRMYLLSSSDSPVLMKELYRLREITFRAIGEGTGLALDTDRYDDYYRQLIMWNVPNGEIAGAYRIGFCQEILTKHGGMSGIYSDSLYRYADKAEPLLAKCLELGRSFIVAKYQKEVVTLKLLLSGLAVVTLKCPEAEYFTGPVSISNEIPVFYKSLIVRFVERDYPFPDADRTVKPSHPFVPDYLKVNPDDLLRSIPPRDIDAFDRLIATLSDGKYRIPVLVRKYFNCGARLACFNVDPLFSNSLDGLIFLRHGDFPPVTLRSLLRGMPGEVQDATLTHFYGSTDI